MIGANGDFAPVDTLDVATLGCTLDDSEELGETWGLSEEGFFELLPGLFSFTSDGADLFVSRAVPCVRQGSLIPTRLSAAICRHIEQTISSLSCERLCASDHLVLLPCGIVVAPSTVTCNHLFVAAIALHMDTKSSLVMLALASFALQQVHWTLPST